MRKTVLICDDTMFIRSAIGQVLTDGGWQVVGEALTGDQAIQMYQHLKPDLVTMDLVMPDMGAIEAVRTIVEADPAARILICSALTQEGLTHHMIQAGVKACLSMPFPPSALLDAAELLVGETSGLVEQAL